MLHYSFLSVVWFLVLVDIFLFNAKGCSYPACSGEKNYRSVHFYKSEVHIWLDIELMALLH